jgi:hypothetical protein
MRVVLCALFALAFAPAILAQDHGPDPEYYPLPCTNTVTANVVALDQSLYYNRFGAFDPNGMVFALARNVVPEVGTEVQPGNAKIRSDLRPRPLVLRVNEGDCLEVTVTNLLDSTLTNNVGTRNLSFNVTGLALAQGAMNGAGLGRNGDAPLAPGQSATYTYFASARGSFHVDSLVSTTGGEGDGGSKAHGLFGAVVVEPAGSSWYRSQVSDNDMNMATIGLNPNGTPIIDYNALDLDGLPVLSILDANNEIVHSDLTAIITDLQGMNCDGMPTSIECGDSYREFVIVFHDEIAIRQAYPELVADPIFHGVRDGFAINYGSAGMGAEVIAVRNGEGPGKDCGECKFEEFFLESWVNGDPAMPVKRDPITGVPFDVTYRSDPSNVNRSYIGDPVRIENLHVGAETHVFHLHAHQWLYSDKDENSTYLDSQSIGPGASFSYDINYGGGGNRNLTPGDSIYHCHLYPHFAQGMWALWRAHDVFEDGSLDRNLPDYELTGGTPNLAVIPLPGRIMPPKPSADMPGYPFYIAGNAGHRAPQPPLDMEHDGGLPRGHILSSTVTDGPAAISAHYQSDPVFQRVSSNNTNPYLLYFARRLDTAEFEFLPQDGTSLEKKAMDYHAGAYNPDSNLGDALAIDTDHGWPAIGYPSFDSSGNPGYFLVNGLAPQPGAPFADPCPPLFVDGNGTIRWTTHRSYDAAYVQFDMTINEYGWHDRQARVAVLNQDVFSTLDGTRTPQPLFFRANSGDCVTFRATNLMPGNLNLDDYQIFTPTDIIGQHIHLVKFDVTSSDGAGNGWNYEDGTFSPEEVRERIHAHNAFVDPDGDGLAADGTPANILTAEAHPYFGSGPNGDWLGAQTTVQRWWVDPCVNNSGEDRTIRSVFTHDHFGPSSHQQHGLYALLVVEPTDSIWFMPDGVTPLGTRADGGPTHWAANIITGFNGAGSYREFVFETGDFMPTYDLANLPVKAPGGVNNPEVISTGGGSEVINYRAEPIGHAMSNAAAYPFSSPGNGDPFTFVGQAYTGDRVQLALAHGAQEGQHSFMVHGARWLQEPSNPDSGYTNMQQYGISEKFEAYFRLGDGMKHTTVPGGATDYFVGQADVSGLRGGAWGLLRAHSAPVEGLATLPGNEDYAARPQHPLRFGVCPTGPGTPPIRSFDLEAWRVADLLGPANNGQGLSISDRFAMSDPNALVFIHADEAAAIAAGTREIEPLVLRVNSGDCIEVTLRNMLPGQMPLAFGAGTGSSRISLNPQMLSYDMGVSDGAAMGANIDTTVGPGEIRQYAWYAGTVTGDTQGNTTWTPMEYGVCNLKSYGDPEGHYKHGLYGVCVVEPAGSSWIDPDTGEESRRFEADIYDANGDLLYREFVLQWMDDMPQTSRFGSMMSPATQGNFQGFNYKTEPLWARLGVLSETPWVQMRSIDQTNVLSSLANLAGCGGLPCGDPETPILEVEAGTRVMVRLAQAAGQVAEPNSFTISGHLWQQQPWTGNSGSCGENPTSRWIGTQGNITSGTHDNMLLMAGGPARASGDYIYRAANNFDYSGGAWGIFRVTPYVRVPAAPCADLACTATEAGVHLSWARGGDDYLAVEVYRDGQLVQALDPAQTWFEDMGVPPGNYEYSVMAVNADLPSTAVSCSGYVAPFGVTNLNCTNDGASTSLTWSTPPQISGYDMIKLTRNGAIVAELDSTATSFVDTECGVGVHEYRLICMVGENASVPTACLSSVAPAGVTGVATVALDPCLGMLEVSWVNSQAYEAISIVANGATVATVAGDTQVSTIMVPGGTGSVCVQALAGGLASESSCGSYTMPEIAPSPIGVLSCTTDSATQTASLTWMNTSEYSSLEILLDGASVATLPGTATTASIPVGYGLHDLQVLGTTICGEAIPSSACSTSITPSTITDLSSTLIDPCTRSMLLTWSNGAAYESISVLLDGVEIATVPGNATAHSLSISSETAELCLRGTISGLQSDPACSLLEAPLVGVDAATGLMIDIDPASLTAQVSWTNSTLLASIEVLVDGVSAASLNGAATSTLISLPGSGAFSVCVAGVTICGDPVEIACAQAQGPTTFERGDCNFDGKLDIGDAMISLAVVFNGDAHLCLDSIDSNDDGALDISDPLVILHALFSGGASPSGSGSCAADLTSDGLDCLGSGCP